MKKYISTFLSLCIFLSLVIKENIVYADAVSIAPTADEVTITNNVNKPDIIYITGVIAGDIINVYNAEVDGKIIGKATVPSNKTDATIKIAQLGTKAGSVYITVTSLGKSESSRTEISYPDEAVSEEPLSYNITVKNNTGKADTIHVCGLGPGDKVNIYTSATGGKLLGSAVVGSNSTEVTKSISQLGIYGGKLYISVTSKDMHESTRVEVTYPAEGQSIAPDSDNIEVTNNSGKSDTIYISGLAPGDKVSVYNAASGGSLLATTTVGSNKSEATLTISQLGVDSGSIYISVTSSGLLESYRTQVIFPGENTSDSVSSDTVTITNNSSSADTIYVTGLASGDKVYVYNASTGGKLLGSAIVASSSSSATITISQLGTSAGSVYISVLTPGIRESSRKKISYSAETESTIVGRDNIVVTNNAGTSDTVYVSGVTEGDVIKVYNASSGGTLLGSATVASGSTEATVTISQLGTSAGTLYVTVTSKNSLESARISVDYTAEGSSSSIDTDNVIITNNSGKSDIVYISGLVANDVVKIYDSASAGTLLGSVTVSSGSTDAIITIPQLGTSAGSIYISKTSSGKSTSSRVKVNYPAENQSKALAADSITVNNNVGADDTIVISGVSTNQVIKLYDSAKIGHY